MCYTGIDPFTKEEVYVARGLRDRKLRRALMQFFKPENYFRTGSATGKATLPALSRGSSPPWRTPSSPTAARRWPGWP
jgi:hypothetical protein